MFFCCCCWKRRRERTRRVKQKGFEFFFPAVLVATSFFFFFFLAPSKQAAFLPPRTEVPRTNKATTNAAPMQAPRIMSRKEEATGPRGGRFRWRCGPKKRFPMPDVEEASSKTPPLAIREAATAAAAARIQAGQDWIIVNAVLSRGLSESGGGEPLALLPLGCCFFSKKTSDRERKNERSSTKKKGREID